MDHLSPSTSLSVCAILEELVDRLNLVSTITPDVSTHQTELSAILGDQVEESLENQRKLEERFAELVRERDSLRGVSKVKLAEKEHEIAELTKKIRNYSGELMSVLKENPNVSENLTLIQEERTNLYHLIQKTIRELRDPIHSFTTLYRLVLNEKNLNQRLHEAEAKYSEAVNNLEQLKNVIDKETKENDILLNTKNSEIENLKSRLQMLKKKWKDETRYSELDENAKTESIAILCQRELDFKLNQIRTLQQQLETERIVFERNTEFLKHRADFLGEEADRWKERLEQDRSNLDNQTRSLKMELDEKRLILADLKHREREEEEEKARKELEAQKKRERDLIEKSIIEFQRRKAAWHIWCFYRDAKAGTLKKKKKKKGKKKGKGKTKKKRK
ncbi:hypothetical protein PCE1_003652 [Barthelona sp. PCE]